MSKKYNTSLSVIKPLFVSGLSLILLIILNFSLDYILVKNILIIIIMFFLPGYSIVNILFEKKPEIPEILVLSVGTSIGIFILIAMGVNFAGQNISVLNILNPVAITSLILGLLYLLKNVFLTKHRVRI
jgi:uncharacterized membrane protein